MDRMRLIAAGCGRVFERYHLPAIRASSGVHLVGVCDPDTERRAWARGAIPDVSSVESIEELTQAVDAHAVLISSPPATHASLIEAALRARLAVLVEKPMTTTVEDAQRVCALQARAGSLVRVGFNRRYRRDYVRVRERIDGLVNRVSFTFIVDAGRWNPSAAATPAFVLHDAGSHAVDLLMHVAAARIVRLRATAASGPTDCMVTVDAVLDGGTLATCTVGHAPRYRERLSIVAEGRERHVWASATGGRRLQIAFRRLTGRPTPTDESFRAQLAGFVRAWQGYPDRIGADATDGLASVVAIAAALESLADGGAWRDTVLKT